MLAISHGVCHVSFPTHLPPSAFQHSAHLMYMKHGRSMYMFPTGQTELSSTCSGRTCGANPCCKWIPLSRRYCFNCIKFDPPFREPFQRCAGAVNGSGAVLLRETAFKTLNCCAWTCHFHSSAFLNIPERSFLLSNETATANRLLLSDKWIINSLLLPEKCLILVWQRSSSLKSCGVHWDLEELVHVFSVLIATWTSKASHFSSQ